MFPGRIHLLKASGKHSSDYLAVFRADFVIRAKKNAILFTCYFQPDKKTGLLFISLGVVDFLYLIGECILTRLTMNALNPGRV